MAPRAPALVGEVNELPERARFFISNGNGSRAAAACGLVVSGQRPVFGARWIQQAVDRVRHALDINEKALGPEHPVVATSLNNLAALYLARNKPAEALRTEGRAAVIENRNATVLLATGSDEQKRAYMATLRGTTDSAISLHVQWAPKLQDAKHHALTAILSRKGRVLDAMTGAFTALRRRLTPGDRKQFDQLRSISAQYTALAWRGPGAAPLDAYRTRLAQLDKKRQDLEDAMSRRSAVLMAELRPITVAQVHSAIPEGAALVELFRYQPLNPRAGRPDNGWGNPRYVAYVLPHRGEIAWADLGEAAPIEAAVEQLLPTLRRAAAEPQPAARALDALVMQPIRRLLGDTRWVFLSPDGALSLVPFAALRGEDGRYLVERYAFTYVASGRDLLRLMATSPSQGGPVILAAPDFGKTPQSAPAPAETDRRSADMGTRAFGPLSFAAEEGRVLRRKLPEATLLTGSEATETAVKALRGPRLLHIATHGFFLPDQPALHAPSPGDFATGVPPLRGGLRPAPYAENPLLRSGLVFAGVNGGHSGKDDGVLTVLEASQLNLDGTKLVVLSACETAVGEARSGDGVYGLRRALVVAGAETQVMSLWRVDDAATREQMEAYYAGLLQGGGRSEALRQVQLAMLRDPRRAHPYCWASFIVSGNPAALDGKPVLPDFAG